MLKHITLANVHEHLDQTVTVGMIAGAPVTGKLVAASREWIELDLGEHLHPSIRTFRPKWDKTIYVTTEGS